MIIGTFKIEEVSPGVMSTSFSFSSEGHGATPEEVHTGEELTKVLTEALAKIAAAASKEVGGSAHMMHGDISAETVDSFRRNAIEKIKRERGLQ